MMMMTTMTMTTTTMTMTKMMMTMTMTTTTMMMMMMMMMTMMMMMMMSCIAFVICVCEQTFVRFFIWLYSFFFQVCHIFVVQISTFEGIQLGSLDADNSTVIFPRGFFGHMSNERNGESCSRWIAGLGLHVVKGVFD